MRKAVRKALFVLLSLCAFAAGQGKDTVAVYMAGVEPKGAQGAHKILGGELEKAISRSPKFVAVNRTDDILNALAKEQGYTRSGAVDDAQIKALGRQLGVQYLCVVEISEAGRGYYLNAKLVDVETAVTVKSGSDGSKLEDYSEMIAVAKRIALELTDVDLGTKPPPSQPVAGSPPPQVVSSPPVVSSPSSAQPGYQPPAPPPGYGGSGRKPGGVSAGGGLVYAGDGGGGFAGWRETDSDYGKWSYAVPWHGFGISLFLDVPYAGFGVSFVSCVGEPQVTSYEGVTKPFVDKNDNTNTQYVTYMGFSALLKYPFALGERMSFFPAAGIEYAVALSGKTVRSNGFEWEWDGQDGADKAGDFSALWFKFGAGLDVPLTGTIFLRAEALYGVRTANKCETDGAEGTEAPLLGHGLTVKVGAGMGF